MRDLSNTACGALALAFTLLWTSAAASQAPKEPQDVIEAGIPIALLVDASNGQVLFERNATRRFVPASITKAMTLYTAFELLDAGEMGLQQSLTVDPDVWAQWGGKGSTMFLNANERVPLPDILTGIATVSANDGAAVLAQQAAGSASAWTALMNSKARSIGMTQSSFGTPNGWPDEGYTFTNAQDLGTLGAALFRDHPQKCARFIGRPNFRYQNITQSNHDPITGKVEGADGIKTGYTNEAGFGFLGTAKRDGKRLVMVIAGANRSNERNRAARDLIEWGFAAFSYIPLFSRGDIVGEARVQGGSSRSLPLVVDRNTGLNLPKGTGQGVELKIEYDGPLRAPIAQGDEVARLRILGPRIPEASIPLYAGETIAPAGFFDRVTNAISSWLP
ncbi:MAG: D-alanyl-D-alanine carboxypeptidase family protein [Pseudomonadota bacterium]